LIFLEKETFSTASTFPALPEVAAIQYTQQSPMYISQFRAARVAGFKPAHSLSFAAALFYFFTSSF
jgi:hypothetical protein